MSFLIEVNTTIFMQICKMEFAYKFWAYLEPCNLVVEL